MAILLKSRHASDIIEVLDVWPIETGRENFWANSSQRGFAKEM